MNKSKSIKSENGKLEVKFSDVTHVCICLVPYALLQYLLLMNEEIVKHHTVYFFGDGVKEQVRAHLPSVYYSTKRISGLKAYIVRRFEKIWLRISKKWKYPFVQSAEIYAQDHEYLSMIIGDNDYNYLSDGPLSMECNYESHYLRQIQKNKSLKGKLEKLVYGNLICNYYGNNAQCKAFFMTENNVIPNLRDRELHVDSLKNLWDKSTDSKKQFVLQVFDVTMQDFNVFSGKETLFLTQPFVDDGVLNAQEYVELLSKIFSHYDREGLLIKAHPRDTFDYQSYFPWVECFYKPINTQLLSLLGVDCKRVISICSSAVNDFPEATEIDWYGSSIHPKIHEFFGNTFVPNRKFNQMTL